MMMRYQRVSPDCIPLSNGKKPSLRPLSREENSISNNDAPRTTAFPSTCTTAASLDGVSKGFRFRSPSRTSQDPQSADVSPSRGGGDVLLQWGQRKRSRVSRAEIRSVTDDSSSSSGQGRPKLQRRASNAAMPPPPPPPPSLLCGIASNGGVHRGPTLRNGFVTSKESSGFVSSRNFEDRSAVANGSPSRAIGGNSRGMSRSAASKRSPSSPDKKVSGTGSGKDEKQNGCTSHTDRVNRSDLALGRSDHEPGGGGGEKANVQVIEWPRIYIALSRKEKEEDFLAMKGTKLPHRPRKRAKNVDRALQSCFPGMWLSDLTKSRYEVREKKSVKKQKRRGLKGLESMDSDSD